MIPDTIKPLLRGHPRELARWPLYRGWPFNRGRADLERFANNQENGGDLLTAQEADVVHSKRREEVSAVPSDKSPGQVEIRFVGDDGARMVKQLDSLTSHMDRLPNEILSKIIYHVLISSTFSWPNHKCHVFSQLCKVNTRFRVIIQRLAFQILHPIYFSSGGVAGNDSVKKTQKNVWAFKWFCAWITANNQIKMGECLAGDCVI